MSDIDNTLAQRGARYGEFTEHADITQGLKTVMNRTPKWAALADDQKEALEMVAHKIGRILNGDPNYIDSWTDIIGYTRLVEKRLIGEQPVVQEFAFGAPVPGPVPTPAAKVPCDCPACTLDDLLSKTLNGGAPKNDYKVVSMKDFLDSLLRPPGT